MPHLHGIVPVHVEANLRPLNIGLHTAWRRAQERTTWKKLMRTATPCQGHATDDDDSWDGSVCNDDRYLSVRLSVYLSHA